MSVELYFVKPDPDGRVIFPFWDDQGEPLFPVEHRVLASLKWAAHKACILDTAAALREEPIPPEQLIQGAESGMQILVSELAQLHPDFRRLADEIGADFQASSGLLYAFEGEQDWVGGDEEARARAFAHARGEAASLHWLLLEIRKAGEQGFYGCWSF